MVDSQQKKIDPMAIATVAIKNTKSEHPLQVALMAIATEMSQPKTLANQFGNTLFILHTGEDGKGVFKALNADTAPNFVQNSNQFLQWAAQKGMRLLVTDFNDPSIMRIIKIIAANPPMQGMGFQSYNLKRGGNRVTINLGGA